MATRIGEVIIIEIIVNHIQPRPDHHKSATTPWPTRPTQHRRHQTGASVIIITQVTRIAAVNTATSKVALATATATDHGHGFVYCNTHNCNQDQTATLN